MRFKTLLFCLFISVLTYSQNAAGEAKEIIEKALLQLAANNPKLALESFQFNQYSKGVFKTQDEKTLKTIASNSNYLFEEVALHTFDKHQKHQKVIVGVNLPGFENPYYPLFVMDFHAVSLYEKEYEILEKRFYGPLSKNGLKHYIFELKETINKNQMPYYVIQFSPANNLAASQLYGVLHIDSKSFALQKAIIRHQKNIDATIVHDFTYIEDSAFWFPSKTTVEVLLLNLAEEFNIFGNSIPQARLRYQEGALVSLTVESHNSDIRFQVEDSRHKNHVDVTATIENLETNDAFWERFRESDFNTEDESIKEEAAASVAENNTEKRIERINDFGLGYLEVGFFDLDLKFLIKYNNYEGFRSGLGGVTNNRLSKHFSLGGYLVRGFKDEEFKYKISTEFNLSKKTETVLGLAYTDDVTEMATNSYLTDRRTFSLFEPRLVNIIQFYKNKTIDMGVRHQINPKVNAEIQLSKNDVSQTLAYAFLNNDESFTEYTITQAKASLVWSPFGRFIKTPYETIEYHIGYPRFSTQVSQSLKGIVDGDFNFTKIDVRADQVFYHINQSLTEVILEGNIGFGEIPLTHMYHAHPNSPNKETIMKRFSVAGIKSFETMYFGEFFSDKIATIHVKHQLNPFLIASWLKPELVLITRHAIGTASNIENHQNINFNTLEKGYSESGFEVNKLIFGFGVSFAYRYGAYQLLEFEDNVSLKFTFNLKL